MSSSGDPTTSVNHPVTIYSSLDSGSTPVASMVRGNVLVISLPSKSLVHSTPLVLNQFQLLSDQDEENNADISTTTDGVQTDGNLHPEEIENDLSGELS